MNRLPLVFSVVALAGAIVSAVLYFQIGNSKRLLEGRLAAATQHAVDLDAKLSAANTANATLSQRLTALDADLGETKSKLTASEARAAQVAHELAQTKVQLAARELASRGLAGEIASLRRDLADARRAAAPAPEVEAYKSTIAALEQQLAEARQGAAVTAAPAASTAAFASRPRAAVISVGPESAFVVLNYGAGRGAASGQTFAIQRGTETVATVLISDVQPRFSVAQVQPDSLRGVLQKGDFAVLTN